MKMCHRISWSLLRWSCWQCLTHLSSRCLLARGIHWRYLYILRKTQSLTQGQRLGSK